MLYILGSGRCGTKTIAHCLGGVHEPRPRIEKDATNFYRGRINALPRLVEKLKTRAAIDTPAVSDYKQSFVIPIIREVDPEAEFLVLIRDPTNSIMSFIRRRWYRRGSNKQADRFRLRPSTEFPEAWTHVMKNAWLWMKPSVYEQVGGWPKLPGVWGYSEQALTLGSWFRGVPVCVDEAFTCVHADYQPQRRFPFSVHRSDPAMNAHYIHAAFFPRTYPAYWRPILERHFGNRNEYITPLESSSFRSLRRQVQWSAVRTEEEFFSLVLGMDFPVKDEPVHA